MKQNTIYAGVRLPQERGDCKTDANDGRAVGRSPGFSASEFSIMRRLVASPGAELVQLERAVATMGRSLAGDLDNLHSRYIVDCVTILEGERVKRVYTLTPEGRQAFMQLLASFYEIPE